MTIIIRWNSGFNLRNALLDDASRLRKPHSDKRTQDLAGGAASPIYYVPRPLDFWRGGSGCKRIAFTTVKIVVLSPKPNASEITATALNPRFFSSIRTVNRDAFLHRYMIFFQ